MNRKVLILENGIKFYGYGFGYFGESQISEIVFNTGMSGYQEVISDLSYAKQIINFTYPLIGNYGINRDDFESLTPYSSGVIVKEYCKFPSNFRNLMTIDEFLNQKKIPGIYGIDTRFLTKILRENGALLGKICDANNHEEEVIEEFKTYKLFGHVKEVSIKTPYISPGDSYKVVLMDFGMKFGILNELNKRGFHVTVVPYDTKAMDILKLNPDGVVLSNGPGDPKELTLVIDEINKLVGNTPLFGICLGHQLFSLSQGADTIKLKYGHRGLNHPVKDLEKNRVYITSQNHGYSVDLNSLSKTNLKLTHVSLNDGTVEGVSIKDKFAFTVQYHPEAKPGPSDSTYLFDEFKSMIKDFKEYK